METILPAIREDVRFIGEPVALGELFDALSKAQGEFTPIGADSHATIALKSGGNYEFSYAGLDVVIAATQPALSKHGLAFMQLLTSDSMTTVLAKGGARVESTIEFSGTASAQEFGSKVTYLKRYARLSVLGVHPCDEDDDANASAGNKLSLQRRNPPAAQPKAEPKPAGLASPDTQRQVIALSKQAGHRSKEELDAFSISRGLGPLAEQTEVTAGRLLVALQALQVQP